VSNATAAQDATERGPEQLRARQPPVVSLFLSNGNQMQLVLLTPNQTLTVSSTPAEVVSLFLSNGNQMQLVLLTPNQTLTVSGTPAGRYGTERCRDVLRDSQK